jgi:hypothetical protein
MPVALIGHWDGKKLDHNQNIDNVLIVRSLQGFLIVSMDATV